MAQTRLMHPPSLSDFGLNLHLLIEVHKAGSLDAGEWACALLNLRAQVPGVLGAAKRVRTMQEPLLWLPLSNDSIT